MRDATRNFKVYRSSAGSGKTWTLVKEYLRLALSSETPSYFKHILAITFTNKAAAELKRRILDGMLMLSEGKKGKDYDEKLTFLIAQEVGIEPDRLNARAFLAWKEMLHSYSDFSVSTIDSFVYKLIRAFAVDLNLQSDFKVEIDQARLNDGAVDTLLSWVGVDKVATAKLSRFASSNIDEGKSWKVRTSVLDKASAANSESAQPYLEQLNALTGKELEDLKKALYAATVQFETKVKGLAQKALGNYESAGLPPEAFYSSMLTKFYHKVITGDIEVSREKLAPRVHSEKDFWCPKSRSEWKELAEQNDAMIVADFDALADLMSSDEAKLYRRRSVVLRHWEATMILGLLQKASTAWKEEMGVVMVGDFNRTIADIIKDNPAPYVYEKIGEWYHHFLIDEFQDTSVVQWQNFLPLIENALSKSKESMVVGDSKQAIYRWRGGEVEQFDSLPEIFSPATDSVASVASILKREIDEIPLNNNWRSGKAIVEFNNDLFDSIKELSPLDLIGYEGSTQTPKSEKPGYVEVVEYADQEEPNECAEEEILLRIREALADEYRQSDIVILTRGNKEIRQFATRLLSEGLGAITVESLAINQALSVRFVTTLSMHLQRPYDQVALAAVLGCLTELSDSPKHHFEVLNKIRKEPSGDIDAFFTKTPLSHLGSLSMLELCETLCLEFDLTPNDGAFLEQLLNCITGLGNPSQLEFNLWWQDNGGKVYVEASDEVDGVRLMTIHTAKGLEFPIVILPTLKKEIKASEFWFAEQDGKVPPVLVKAAGSKTDSLGGAFVVERNKAIIDELNVLYVGLTRPVDRLHWLLISGKRKSVNPVHKWIDESLTKLNSKWGGVSSIEFGQKVKCVGEKEAIIEDGQTQMSCSPLHLNGSMKLEELTTGEDRTEAASIGIAVHDILSGIGNIEQVDLDDFLTLKLRSVDDEIKSKVEGHIRRVMQNEQLRSWFECESFRERDLIDSQSKIQRPDRICVLENGLAVVDFKTGIVKEEHKVQVEDYVQLLTQIEEKSVKGYLMYTDSLELVEV